MPQATSKLVLLALAAVAAAGSAACLGEDATAGAPDVTSDAGAADGGSPGDGGVAAPPADAGPGLATECPPPGAPVACPAAPVDVGVPALHLDACTLDAKNGRIDAWPSTDGKLVMQGTPGALLCQASLNGRPAVHFDRDGFRLAAGDALALDGAPEFWLAVVMDYAPGARPESAAGGVVFQRVGAAYPFPGPQVTAGFVYQAQSGAPASFEATNLLGGSMRFGVKSTGLAESTFAAVADTPMSGPMVVVFRRLGDTLSLRVNGKEVASATRPDGAGFADGAGNPVGLGRGPGENAYYRGKVGELLFYKSTPASSVELEAELMGRWGIAR